MTTSYIHGTSRESLETETRFFVNYIINNPDKAPFTKAVLQETQGFVYDLSDECWLRLCSHQQLAIFEEGSYDNFTNETQIISKLQMVCIIILDYMKEKDKDRVKWDQLLEHDSRITVEKRDLVSYIEKHYPRDLSVQTEGHDTFILKKGKCISYKYLKKNLERGSMLIQDVINSYPDAFKDIIKKRDEGEVYIGSFNSDYNNMRVWIIPPPLSDSVQERLMSLTSSLLS